MLKNLNEKTIKHFMKNFKNKYESFQQKRYIKKANKEHLKGLNFNNRNKGMGKISSNSVFRVLGMLNGIPAILVIIFIWRRWGDISDWFNNLFTKSSNYFRGRISDLPQNQSYYEDQVKIVYDSINGLSIWNTAFYDVIMLCTLNELQYVTDLYNSKLFFDKQGLVIDIKNETIDQYYWNKLKDKFLVAGIPF